VTTDHAPVISALIVTGAIVVLAVFVFLGVAPRAGDLVHSAQRTKSLNDPKAPPKEPPKAPLTEAEKIAIYNLIFGTAY